MKTNKFRTAGWLATAGLVTAALIAPANVGAASVSPTFVEGNVTVEDCPQGTTGLYLDEETTSGEAAGVTVTIVYDSEAKSLDFTAEGGVVVHAFVKGGDNYNWYDYSPDGVTSDTDLVAPDNASNGPAGLSHVVFCVADVEETPTPTPTPEETPTPTPTGSVDAETGTPDPTGSVQAETGTPTTTLPPTDTLTASAAANDSWRLLLIAMAGILATVLVLTPSKKAR